MRCVSIFFCLLLATLSSSQKTNSDSADDCLEEQCSQSTDVCEPMVLNQNIGSRHFVLFCNFTQLTDGLIYEVEVRRADSDLPWTSKGLFNKTLMRIQELNPFTKYAVRAVLKQRNSIRGISANVFFETKTSKEAPSDSPQEVYISSPEAGTINVAWKPPLMANSPILEYVLEFYSSGEKNTMVTVLPTSNFKTVDELKGDANYTVAIRARNRFGEGPRYSGTVFVEKPSSQLTGDNTLLCASKSALSTFFTEYSYDEPIKTNPKLDGIIDIAVDTLRKMAYIASSETKISRLNLNEIIEDEETVVAVVPVWLSPEPIIAIDFDWLNTTLFVLHETSISIVTMKERVQVTNSPLSPQFYFSENIAVDRRDGFLFLLHQGNLYSTDLYVDGQELVNFRHIAGKGNLVDFTLKPISQSIIIASAKNLTIVPYGGGEEKKVNTSLEKNARIFGAIAAGKKNDIYSVLIDKDSRSIWIVTPKPNKTDEYRISPSTDQSIHRLVSEGKHSQPLPVPFRPPTGITALCWRSRCRLEWRPPNLNTGAGPAAWSHWSYSMLWQGLPAEENKVETFLPPQRRQNLTDLLPGRCYSVRVAAAFGIKKGPASSPSVACTTSLPAKLKLAIFYVHNGALQLEELNTEGTILKRTVPAKLTFSLDKIVARGKDVWSTDSHGGVHHLVGGGWQTLTLPRVHVFVVEHLTRTLYFVSNTDKWIYRWRPEWSAAELLVRSSGVLAMTLDAMGAHLFWCTDRVIFRSKLHGEDSVALYKLPAKLRESSMSNVIWDSYGQRLLFLVQSEYTDNTAQLWQLQANANGTIANGNVLTSIYPISDPRTLIVIGDNIYWEHQSTLFTAHVRANLTGQLKHNISTFHIGPEPNDSGSPTNLFPCNVSRTSIQTSGTNWHKFRIQWRCSGNTTPDKMKFKVKVAYNGLIRRRVTKVPYIDLRRVPGNSLLDISVQPFTRWIRGQVSRRSIRSPFQEPEPPRNIRLFYRNSLNLLTDSRKSIGEVCWTSRPQMSRPIDYFQMRITCPNCEREWWNISKNENCYAFVSKINRSLLNSECVEVQSCSETLGCSPEITVGCSNTKADETDKILKIDKDILGKFNASKYVIFWSQRTFVLTNKTKPFLFLLKLTENYTQLKELTDLEANGIVEYLAADWMRSQLFWTEGVQSSTLWKSNLSNFLISRRRLNTFPNGIRDLTVNSFDGIVQWHSMIGNGTTERPISSLQGLSFFANAYTDASVSKCQVWIKEAIACEHPETALFRLMIHPRQHTIIEFSKEGQLCRHLKIKGNSQSHASLNLVQRCFVAKSSTRSRRSASSRPASVILADTGDRWRLNIRRDSGDMVASQSHLQPFRCKDIRGRFLIMQCGPRRVSIKWRINDRNVSRVMVQHKTQNGSYKERQSLFKKFSKTTPMIISTELEKLQPNTVYIFRVGLILNACETCDSKKHKFYVHHEPPDDKETCQCRTRAAIPEPPKKPNYQHLDASNYRITWDQPNDYGSKIFQYLVDRRDNVTNNTETVNVKKESVDLKILRPTDIKIRAQNAIGISQQSPKLRINPIPSKAAVMSQVASPVVVGLAAALFFILVAIIIGSFCWYRRKRSFNHRRSHLNQLTMQMEMRNLSGSPGPTEVNALYANATKMEAIERLPRISRHQLEISSNKYLGAGAFGQVWEGVAKGLFPDTPERRLPVAMKTLRRGATSQEREDFLQEAQLMSNFNHDHIVRLLGVCLEGEPQFIILELMNKGDLKSYLRAARPSLKDSLAALSVSNLLGIIIDVAKGCGYLEEQHFVHRDIAARNCLVNYQPDGTRVTKIGDFGLARDVYRSDYYRNQRKEAMLPVRWMSPEALVDGLFSSQSDVWAFGVLCWEVMTLGQQPYAARTHSQVMRFVRAGGVLDRPSACPEQLYQLMVLCWSFSSQLRPTFHQILNSLYGFQTQSRDPYSPFSQPFYFQNYVTQDASMGATAGTGTLSSGDSSECTSQLLCPAAVPAADDEETLCPGAGYETPLSRPYLDLQPDILTQHYVNSRIVVALPPPGTTRHRPLSIDSARPLEVGIPPPAATIPRTTHRQHSAGDVNYRSIRVEEPELSEYQVPEPQPSSGPASTSNSTASRPSAGNQTATMRSTASSSNGESSMSASTGSRTSALLPPGPGTPGDGEGATSNKSGTTLTGRPTMGVQQATSAAKAASDYASRHYDRL